MSTKWKTCAVEIASRAFYFFRNGICLSGHSRTHAHNPISFLIHRTGVYAWSIVVLYSTAYLAVQSMFSLKIDMCNCVLQFRRKKFPRESLSTEKRMYLLVDAQAHRLPIWQFYFFYFLNLVSLHIWWFGTHGINHRQQIGCANGYRTNHAVDIFAHFLHHLRARRHRIEHARVLRIDNDFPRFGVPFGDIGMRGQLCQHARIWIGPRLDLHTYGRTHYEEIRLRPCASSRHRRLCNSIAAIVQSKFLSAIKSEVNKEINRICLPLSLSLTQSDSRNYVFRNAQHCCEHFAAL